MGGCCVKMTARCAIGRQRPMAAAGVSGRETGRGFTAMASRWRCALCRCGQRQDQPHGQRQQQQRAKESHAASVAQPMLPEFELAQVISIFIVFKEWCNLFKEIPI
jgi:CDGSH-type Zn-finger protein